MKITAKSILRKKRRGKIVCLTAYDFLFARILDEVGVDIILVGDSVGMVLLGYETTIKVTLPEMLHHTKAVARAVKRSLVVADMPFGTYEKSSEAALRNAKRLVEEGGADAVKLEGGNERIAKTVKAIVRGGIPVMGHVGMLPQSVAKLGGYKVQGRTPEGAKRILDDAKRLEAAGVFSIVLECVPAKLAEQVTKKVSCPTIGIGAGPKTDGQILVLHDLLGFEGPVRPRFVRRYAEFEKEAKEAFRRYRREVLTGRFPSLKESFE